NELAQRWNQLPAWARSPNLGVLRPERGWPFENSFSAPSWARMTWPGKSFGRSGPTVRSPSFGGGAAADGDRWSWLLMAVIALLGGLFAWRMIRWREEQTARRTKPWRLGPWPVDPATVS